MPLALAIGRWLFLALLGLFLYQLYRQIARDLETSGPHEQPRPRGPLVLRALAGEGMCAPGRTYPLDAPLSIGRGDDNALIIGDPFCSGHHARIDADVDGPWIEDLGSTNGTWLDGRRLEAHQAVRLQDGMRLDFGATKLRVER